MGVLVYQISSNGLSLQDLPWWFCWNEWSTPAPIDWDAIPLFLVIQLPSAKAHSFQSGALSFSKHFCCSWWEETWLWNVLLMSPIFTLITLFLQSLGSLHIFVILGSILSIGGLWKVMVPAFFKFQIAAGDRSCFIFSDQDRCLY